MATALRPSGPAGALSAPPPSLSALTIEIATCLREASAAGPGPTQPSAGEPVAARMRALLPQLLGTCVEAAGTSAARPETDLHTVHQLVDMALRAYPTALVGCPAAHASAATCVGRLLALAASGAAPGKGGPRPGELRAPFLKNALDALALVAATEEAACTAAAGEGDEGEEGEDEDDENRPPAPPEQAPAFAPLTAGLAALAAGAAAALGRLLAPPPGGDDEAADDASNPTIAIPLLDRASADLLLLGGRGEAGAGAGPAPPRGALSPPPPPHCPPAAARVDTPTRAALLGAAALTALARALALRPVDALEGVSPAAVAPVVGRLLAVGAAAVSAGGGGGKGGTPDAATTAATTLLVAALDAAAALVAAVGPDSAAVAALAPALEGPAAAAAGCCCCSGQSVVTPAARLLSTLAVSRPRSPALDGRAVHALASAAAGATADPAASAALLEALAAVVAASPAGTAPSLAAVAPGVLRRADGRAGGDALVSALVCLADCIGGDALDAALGGESGGVPASAASTPAAKRRRVAAGAGAPHLPVPPPAAAAAATLASTLARTAPTAAMPRGWTRADQGRALAALLAGLGGASPGVRSAARPAVAAWAEAALAPSAGGDVADHSTSIALALACVDAYFAACLRGAGGAVAAGEAAPPAAAAAARDGARALGLGRDALRSLAALPWAAASAASSSSSSSSTSAWSDAAKLASLRVSVAAALLDVSGAPGEGGGLSAAAASAALGRGTPVARALEDAAPAVRAGGAWAAAALGAACPRAAAKGVASSLARLAGAEVELGPGEWTPAVVAATADAAASLAAARAAAPPGNAGLPLPALLGVLARSCSGMEADSPSPLVRQWVGGRAAGGAWAAASAGGHPPSQPPTAAPFPGDVAAALADATLAPPSPLPPPVQAAGVRALFAWLAAAPADEPAARGLAPRLLAAVASPSCAGVRASAAAAFAAARTAPPALLVAFADGAAAVAAAGRADPATAAAAAARCEVRLLQALSTGFEGARPSARPTSLVALAAAAAGCHGSGADVFARVSMLKALGDPEAAVRAAAGELLGAMAVVQYHGRRPPSSSAAAAATALPLPALPAADVAAAVRRFVFARPQLLNYVGRSLGGQPALLGELADLVDGPDEVALARHHVAPACVPALVEARDGPGLAALARRAGYVGRAGRSTTSAAAAVNLLLREHGHLAIARALWEGSTPDNRFDMDGFITYFDRGLTGRLEEGSGGGGAAQAPTATTTRRARGGSGDATATAAANNPPSQSFFDFVTGPEVVQRTIMELVARAGSAPGWGGGARQAPPEVHRQVRSMLGSLADMAGVRGVAAPEPGDVPSPAAIANYLASGDAMVRILKAYGDALDAAVGASSAAAAAAGGATSAVGGVQSPLNVLRCVTLLIGLSGRHVSRFLPQFTVLLGMGVRGSGGGGAAASTDDAAPPPAPAPTPTPTPTPTSGIPLLARLQALEGWRALVSALAHHAPDQLAAVAGQVVVALLDPAVAGGPAAAGAAAALEELVLRGGLPSVALAALPPLPAGPAELAAVRSALNAARTAAGAGAAGTAEARARALLAPLASPAPAVRATAAAELRDHLASHRSWLGSLLTAAAGARGPATAGPGAAAAAAAAVAAAAPAAPGASTSAADDEAAATASARGLLSSLVTGLLACCAPGVDGPAGGAAALAAAECLGLVGAVDPALIGRGGGGGGGSGGATAAGGGHSLLGAVPATPAATGAAAAADNPALPGPSPATATAPPGDRAGLPAALLAGHLVRLLRVADSMRTLDAATFAIQELLRSYGHCGGGEGAGGGSAPRSAAATAAVAAAACPLLDTLPADDRELVAPFLTSKYSIAGAPYREEAGPIFSAGTPAWRWLASWLRRLVDRHVAGPWAKLHQACTIVLRRDVGTALFLLPHAVADALAHGGEAASAEVAAEVCAVLAGGRASREGGLAVQAVFGLLDTLAAWADATEAAAAAAAAERAAAERAAATRAAGGAAEPSRRGSQPAAVTAPPVPGPAQGGIDAAALRACLDRIPLGAIADAAAAASAHARALRAGEEAARAAHGGGGGNPSALASATYDDATVSFLMAVYASLGEPDGDGLAGLARLRAPLAARAAAADDELAVAEAAGAWGEALALRERQLAQGEGGGGDGMAGVVWEAAPPPPPAQAAPPPASRRRRRTGAATGTARIGTPSQPSPAEAAPPPPAPPPASLPQGLPLARRGHLRCLLGMGHTAGALAEADGWLASTPTSNGPARAALAAVGVAAAWRLGRWEELDGRLAAARGGQGGEGTPPALTAAPALAALGALSTSPPSWAVSGEDAVAAAGVDDDGAWEVRVGGALAALHARDGGRLRRELAAARAALVPALRAASLEASYERAHGAVVRLHMLQEVEDAAALLVAARGAGALEAVTGGAAHGAAAPAAAATTGPLDRARRLRWGERLAAARPALAAQAPILALRIQLARLAGSPADAGGACLALAALSRAGGHMEAAAAAALEASALGAPGAALERARLLWDRDAPTRALALLREECAALDVSRGGATPAHASPPEARRREAEALLQLGRWSAEAGQGTFADVSDLFKRAIGLAPRGSPVGAEANFHYGAYLDALAADAKARQGGTAGAERVGGGGSAGAGASAAAAPPASRTDRLSGRSRIPLGEDIPFVEITGAALRHYGAAVGLGSDHAAQALPRLLTAFFEVGSRCVAVPRPPSPRERAARGEVLAGMQGLVKALPMRAWLPALPQLTSRVCHPHPETQGVARHLLTRVAAAYPHQSLWALAAVAKSAVPARAEAAAAILASAKRHAQPGRQEAARRLHAAFAALCDQLIRLCHHAPAGRARSFSVRREFAALARLAPLGIVVPVSAALAAAPAACEGGLGEEGGDAAAASPVVSIAGFGDEVTLLVSLQRPKRLTLIGSDGRAYGFLAKPKDDLRKDARMMEVAGVANALFAREPAASRRGLRLRRFAVQPLAEDCGLVEWVSATATLRTCCQEVLEADGAYSARSTNPQIKAWYDEATGPGGAGSPARRKVEWLERVLGALPPRLHAWYAATFRDPAAWHAARLALARGAAAWSVVGHVVGLGDRHGENVLLCGRAGEVVHVDFSCLFDKGLTLEKPEVVPFRLTQNIIDAFGLAGVEGAFRPAAEATLAALRAHRETLLSVLETFVHDPLVEWSRGAAAAAALSIGGRNAAAAAGGGGGGGGGAGGEADNPQAQDAMATMRGRLTGTLLGVRSAPCLPLAVPGQVARLIDEATDRGNLADMYIWWMAWF